MQGGHGMTMDEVKAVKHELQQLSAELKIFKEELLTTRVKELEQIARADHVFFSGKRVKTRIYLN